MSNPRLPFLVAATFSALVLILTLGLPATSPAYADEFPTWEEVQEARKDVASAEKKVKEITALLEKLEVAQSTIDRIVASDDAQQLAKLLQELWG